MRKIIQVLLCLLLVSGSLIPVFAEEDDIYYLTLCSGSDLSEEQKAECQRYASQKNQELNDQLNEIKKKRKEIEADLTKVGREISSYEKQITDLQGQIETLNTQIGEKEALIASLEVQISESEVKVNDLRDKVADRLVRSQQTMHTNQFLDFLMGAEDFTSLLRRIQGVNDIMNYDKRSLEELKSLMDQLNLDKENLNSEKEALVLSKAEIEEKKAQIVSMKATAELAKQKYEEQAADLEAEGNKISGSLSELKGMLNSLGLGAIASSSGFTRPTTTGYKSAGTWHYGSGLMVNGGVHLGMDIAAGVGTPIYAAGNGVVLASADGCPNNGYIGNSCGESQGGSRGGGNQVYLLTSINDVTYAVKYLHMSPNSVAKVGTIVNAGDQIGTLGKSGNVTGAHVHIEVFRLGTMSLADYAGSWNGDLSFGAGWGSAGLNHRCSNSSSPCRVRPEEVFGY